MIICVNDVRIFRSGFSTNDRFRTLFDEGLLGTPKRESSKSEKELDFVGHPCSDATHKNDV